MTREARAEFARSRAAHAWLVTVAPVLLLLVTAWPLHLMAQNGKPASPVTAAGAATPAHVRALADAGRYDDAELAARRLSTGARGEVFLVPLGEVLLARGRLAGAESAFVRAVAQRAPDSLTAGVRLAVLHHAHGDRERAAREFDRFIDIYNGHAASLTSGDFIAVAVACRYLGITSPQLFKDALKALDRAIETDRANADAQSELGELFVSKYNGTDAQSAFAAALFLRPDDPRALTGEARRRLADQHPGGDSLLARALAQNASYVPALALMARSLMDREQYADARRTIERALAVNPSSLDALSVAAALAFLVGDQRGFEARQLHAQALYPRNGALLAATADAAASVRRYDVAADFARQSIAADAQDWRAHGLLGLNLMRLGRIAEGRASLATSFAGDPYNVWIKNTLDLIDTFAHYDTTATTHATLMIETQESPLLSIYLSALVEDAWKTFSTRYGYEPPSRVRIEVYRSEADFSVRTIGMPGIGALGVSFGLSLAFNSPAARDAGPFNWGSTAWHEIAHTFTLGASDHRVPRWFSEGLSVWEEHRARRGWGFGVTPSFLDALRAGKLVPASRMNDGFTRPDYPEQVVHSYFEASLICDLIAAEHGEQALVTMLREYKAGRSTDEVFARVLATTVDAFDRKFDTYMKTRFANARPISTDELVARAATMARAGRRDEAIAQLRTAVYQDATHLVAHHSLAGLLALANDRSHDVEEADVLERSLYINPFEVETHVRLARLHGTLGHLGTVVRERRAIVALSPVDIADAWYELAAAQFIAGDLVGAKASVLRALEEAPSFAKAQDLLLTLVDGRQP